MKLIDVAYLRISQKDEEKDLNEKQLPEILKRFDLDKEKLHIIIEQISAYKDDVQEQRTGFLELKKLIEDGVCKNVYVYSLERLQRNMARMLEFYFFCEKHGVTIHSVLQPMLSQDIGDKEDPFYMYQKYNIALMYAWVGQNESYLTSKRTRKDVRKKGNITLSSKGKVWGMRLTNLQGERIELSYKKKKEIVEYIDSLIADYERRGLKGYYPLLMQKIAEVHQINISKAYLSIARKRYIKNGGK